jgi:NAD(P)-dependent dehydrogenase (short-subunit alcohol dehydrogenase family)
MKQNILVTGSSSGFGLLMTKALAAAGHKVFASMRNMDSKNAPIAAELKQFSADRGYDIEVVEIDVQEQQSIDTTVAKIISDKGGIDVLIHNAGHMSFGPAEAFSTEQLAQLYDINVISTQRLNKAVLPHMRGKKKGLLIWISSSSSAGGTPPYLAPYFAAKAAMDSLAVQYARELARWGIETSIVVPGAFTKGTSHFENAGSPADLNTVDQYENGPTKGLGEEIQKAFAEIVPEDADVNVVAKRVVDIVDLPFGKRPFRIHVDPSNDGAKVGFAVLDRLREEMLNRVGLEDLLVPVNNG